MRTKVPIKNAVHRVDGTAGIKQHCQAYPKDESVSRLNLVIGELLLFGNKQQSEFWPLFEALLVQSYASIPQIPRQSVDKALEWTISHRPE